MCKTGDTCDEKDESCDEGIHSGNNLREILETSPAVNPFIPTKIFKTIFGNLKKTLLLNLGGVK